MEASIDLDVQASSGKFIGPLEGCPLLELPTGPVEERLVCHGSGVGLFVFVLRARHWHHQASAGSAAARPADTVATEINMLRYVLRISIFVSLYHVVEWWHFPALFL